MSILVKPPKRKLSDLGGPVDQTRRLSHSPYTSQSSHSHTPQVGEPAYAADAPRPRNFSTQSEHAEASHWFAPALRDLTSSRQSPAAFDSPFQAQRKFPPNASIVLTGIRGTGKSSLAVILAATSGRRLIDADRYFQQVTGRSRASYKKEFELPEYRQQEARVMESMLAEHQEGCVIACGPGSMERSGQTLLREYAKTHPVIYIIRDPQSIQSYLKAWNTDKVRRFLELSGPIYRACSNLEFFNVSEKGMADHAAPKDGHDSLELELDQRFQAITPFLTLKRLQRDFLCFVAFATGDATDLSNHNSSFPLSMQPVESRTFTYAVTVPISSILERDLDIEELESMADAFELKLDVAEPPSSHLGLDSGFADRISQAVANTRRNTVVPLIFHVESNLLVEHNVLRRSDAEYLKLVQHGLRLAPEFVTVDMSYDDNVLSQVIAAKGSSQVIGHFAASRAPSRGWDDPLYPEIYERAKRLGCDMLRLSQPAMTIDDNFAVQRFRDHIKSLPASLPVIAYNSGPLGRLSCCFNPILTPVVHPSLISEIQTKGLPCITLREAQQALYSSFTLDPLQFFVFGANVTYSLSPAMHNAAYKRCGMPHEYKYHQSPSLRGLNELVENPHFGGTSVSLPYKTESIPLLHSMSPHAQAIGAVNTLIPIRRLEDKALVSENSSLYMEKSRAGPIKALYGDNTDWIGIGNCFRRGLSPANAIRPSSTGLVIGAGGMARAAVYAMIHLGLQNIFVFNRTTANADKLAYHYNRQNLPSPGRDASAARPQVHVVQSLHDSWPANYKQPTVVCSCIPTHSIGGQPAPNFEMPGQWLESPTGGVVVELAYKTLNTPLIQQMRALSHRGWVAMDGLDVLPEQGFAQFELFTGHRAPRRLMRTVVLKEFEGEGQHTEQLQSRLENLEGRPT
ncbi:quinate pathway repressor protein QutR [Aspergillus heteromorphus CBS 117.55]|uniref:Quinate pathway repressor protein QutR n=1 Tax=Aspergillus heteromorphus CBS 117.55 TaxID=1448321 RepID=A0A317WWP4_9EURO|nr:quinate pathway repressor protein QutR [Aspergillus heteromorphus CBS 117.55]PWY89732.1 quinate pathway repressor protein QutR [Aspergillus heteromorphus CBS 117.55]